MRRSVLFGAAMLSLIGSGFGCRCIDPAPLSECAVSENQTALLVTVKCVKSLQCDIFTGTAVADVMIDQVFRDNTDLSLTSGTMATLKSGLQGSLCGVGGSFTPNMQMIVFANIPVPRFNSSDDGDMMVLPEGALELVEDEAATSRRRLMQQASIAVSAATDGENSTVDVEVDVDPENFSVFSDGTVCDAMDADLETILCSGNVPEPSMQNITDLMIGCMGS